MAGIMTKLVPGETPGTHVEAEGSLLDLLNPLVPAATTPGTLVKLALSTMLLNLLVR